MAIKLVSRKDWGARAPKATPSRLGSTRGVKVHYMGEHVDPALLDHHERCDDLVRRIQNSHMDGNGWNDLGYTALVCSHGYVYRGRGPNVLPAANGEGLNSGHYAVCALLGDTGLTKPTDAMLHGLRDAIEWLRAEGDAGNEIKGHRDGYATSCPGAPLYAWVRNGAPRPKGTSMALTDADAAKVADAVKNVTYNASGHKAKESWQAAKNFAEEVEPQIAEIFSRVGRIEENVQAILSIVSGGPVLGGPEGQD